MTVERLATIEYEVDAEELVRLLAAPNHKDPSEITDPIALFGTAPADPDPFPLSAMPTAMALAA